MATALEKIDSILQDLEKVTGLSAFCSKKCDGKSRFSLAYWKIRGLAQPARIMLHYGGHSNFENVVYNMGPPPEYNRSEWLDVKFSMNLDFPNLPYLIDHQHDVRITESQAIYRYLARELKIGCSDSQGIAVEEMLADTLKDIQGQWVKVVYSKDYDTLISGFVQQLPTLLKPLETWLGGKRKWLGGKHLCYADFILFPFLQQITKAVPKGLDTLPELARFFKEFQALPELEQFFKSEASKYPMNGPSGRIQ